MVSVLVLGCGRSDMASDRVVDGGGGELGTDAGPLDSGTPFDAGSPDAGSTDGGLWCCLDQQPCLANGWESGKQGRCCISRMTCKARAVDGGGFGYCEY